jgi:uncharacterized damage-inducible protein DinB
MKSSDLLIDGLGRVREVVHEVAAGLTAEQLAYRPVPTANSICWLIWHLARVQDAQIAEVAGREQVWIAQDWASRFGLPPGYADTGYGHSPGEVGAFQVSSAELLTGYHDAVHEQSVAFLGLINDDDLDRIVDERWDPPVSLGVRLISVIDDDAQHAGQAAYVRGLIEAGGR